MNISSLLLDVIEFRMVQGLYWEVSLSLKDSIYEKLLEGGHIAGSLDLVISMELVNEY